MKKIFLIVSIFIIAFFGLVYLSVSGKSGESGTSIIEDFEELEEIDFRKYDSVIVAASTLYKGNLLKEVMQGENYRKAWSTPVKVPVVFLDTLAGGMEIVKEGGGKQTHSLRLKSAAGVVYSLRSINKDPEPLVPEIARSLGLENVVIDGISAQHPYGALAAASMAGAAGILHTHPKPVFIPKQGTLGDHNERYGNRLFLLEYETEGEINWTHYTDVVEILDTEDLQELKAEMGEKLKIDRNALVRARLFDLLIGDWDRHAKQWGWVVQKNSENFLAIPLAGDRDNAFFNPSGVIPRIVTNKNIQPLVRPFGEEIDYMAGLVYPFDIYFLHNTPESVFVEEAENLQKMLSDREIKEAFKSWPPEIRELDEEQITEKIKNRRDHLLEYAIEFRTALQEKPLLTEPLKGSEDLNLSKGLLSCFECDNR